MKKWLIAFLLMGPPGMAYAQGNPTDTTHWYDFWLGHWDLTWQHSDGSTGTGTNEISKRLDSTVIEEQFRALTGPLAGYQGTSLSVFTPRLGVWKQVWVDSQGGFLEFTGRREGDRYYFETEPQAQAAGVTQKRMVFYDIGPNTLTWDWESTQDGGESWTLNWRIHYQRQQP